MSEIAHQIHAITPAMFMLPMLVFIEQRFWVGALTMGAMMIATAIWS